MKTDENYYYPETEKERVYFIGSEYDEMYSIGGWTDPCDYKLYIDDFEQLSRVKIRIPKFTLEDLKDKDIVFYLCELRVVNKYLIEQIKKDIEVGCVEKLELQIGRNTWVEIKTN